MKNFFTSMLGALVALLIFSGGAFVLVIGFVGAIAAIGGGEKATPELERGAYVVFDLSTNITDAPPPIDFGSLGVARDDHLQLRTVTRALRAAAKDERIAGVFVTGGLRPASYGSGYAALSEVRAGIAAVKAAGKPVMAYLTTATTKDYYLASAASEVAIDPYGVIMMSGLASEPMFYAGAFEKYGVGVQVTRVGKYKAAVEPFTRTSMSPENRDQIQKLLNDIWDGILADIAPSRGTTAAQIQAIVDREGFIRPEQAKDGQLVDRIAYRDEVYDELKAKTGRAGSKQPFKQISLGDYARLSKDIADVPAKALEATVSGSGKGRVAVVYAEGEIVDGEGDADEVGGTRFSRELRKLRLDDGVKAVVLRVNSPGGSASASETIQREIRLMKKVKPVVVSMGSYAASGGYWIAAYGDRIFAEPTTITGSIGVFGVQFDVKKLSGDFGLTFDTVKTGKFADVISITRPKSEEELAVFQRMVDWIYGEFIGKVAEARKIKREVVEEIAQGRVWSGVEAKKLGLVDELGGLDAAIASAVAQAKLGPSYRLVEYPHPKELFEAVQELIEKIAPNNVRAPGLAVKLAERIEREVSVLRTFNDPQGVYARLPLNLSLR
ncbi:MAG: signal peptide peptidase SppA [Opitutia bacterium]|nr:MAG: signal peptide peptidase SppA [Opitutae bacterium]